MIKIGRAASALLLWVSLVSVSVWAQQGTVVSSTVDRNKLEVDDTFTLTVVVQSTESVDIDEPRLPNLSGVDLIQRWDNTAVQQSLVQTDKGMDFKTIRKREFHYMFQAKAQGRYSIDAFEVVVNGKLFKTEPIIVEVMAAGQAPQNPRGRGRAQPQEEEESDEEAFLRQQEEVFNQLLQRNFGGGGLQIPQPGNRPGRPPADPQFRSVPSEAEQNDAFFIQLEVDKTSVFEGEQVTATWYLLTRGQPETLDRVKFPALRGFWKEIIEENPQIQFSEEIINGIPYRKALLASHALFPIKAGKAVIDEFTVKSRVRMPSRNFGFGVGRAYEYTKSSKRVNLEVKALPLTGRPSSFTGAIGQYNVTAQVEGTQFPVNQPFSYKIRFEGQGNAKAIDLPGIEWPDGIEVYDSKSESRFFKDGNSFKEFEVLLIPRKEGPMEIPGVSFSFFNPKTQKYEQKQTAPVQLNISAGVAGAAANNGNTFVGDEKKKEALALTLPALIESPLLAKEKVGLAGALSTGNVSAQATGLWALWSSVMGLITLVLAGIGYKELKTQTRSVSLRKKLDQQWKKVEAAQAENNSKQVGIEIVNAFNLVLSEVSSHKSETQEIQKMLDKLDPDRREKLGKSMIACYEGAQLLGFAPDSSVAELRQKDMVKELVLKSKQILNQACE